MRLGLFAQSILEYTGVSSGADLQDTLTRAGDALVTGLKNIDQRTWLFIGGGLVVLLYFTRRRPR